MGDLLGQPGRAEAQVAGIDDAAARARRAAGARGLTALPLQRRGWVSGGDSLMTSLLAEVGLANAAAGLGVGAWGANHERSICAGFDLGLDAIATDDPPLALRLRP